jgi:hypothetical protein
LKKGHEAVWLSGALVVCGGGGELVTEVTSPSVEGECELVTEVTSPSVEGECELVTEVTSPSVDAAHAGSYTTALASVIVSRMGTMRRMNGTLIFLTGAGAMFMPADALVFENHVQQAVANLTVGRCANFFSALG